MVLSCSTNFDAKLTLFSEKTRYYFDNIAYFRAPKELKKLKSASARSVPYRLTGAKKGLCGYERRHFAHSASGPFTKIAMLVIGKSMPVIGKSMPIVGKSMLVITCK